MRPASPKGPRKKLPALAAVLVASIVIAAPALGSYGLLASFGDTGEGPGYVGPHAPAIAVDPDGRVYVADAKDNRIEAFTNDGQPDGGWGGLTGLTGIAAAPDGTLVVSSDAGVQRYAFDGTLLDEVTHLDAHPGGVGVGPDGAVYVTDPANGRVVIPGRAALDGLSRPTAVAAGEDGRVYVVDAGDGRVHVFEDGAETGSWGFDGPTGVAVAPDGSVFVTAADGDVDRGSEHSRSGRLVHLGADGSPIEDFGSINGPHGVASDCRGRAYVVDNSALRIHVFGEDGPPPPCEVPEPSPEPTPAPTVEVKPAVVASEPEPLLGVRARASTVAGDVKVGSGNKLHSLKGKELIPIGSTVDASDGRVKLEFETAPGQDRAKYGKLMDGEFYDGAFTISQSSKDSLVDLELLDDALAAKSSGARASASKARRFKRAGKRLKVWGKARGRFRTKGRNGAATVRGTEWLTEERDNGTLFRVREGVVEVREFATGDRIVLHAGESFLAKPACVSRRKFRIRLRTPSLAQVRRAIVKVNGKRVKVRARKRLTAPIDLRGRPAGVVRVRIRVRTTDGRLLKGKRIYRTCSTKPLRPTRPPEL